MQCFEIGAVFFPVDTVESVGMLMTSLQPGRQAYSGDSYRALRLACFAAAFAIVFLAEESATAQNREPE